MWRWHLALYALFASVAHGFAPAPIRWGATRSHMYVLAPAPSTLPDIAAVPLKLTIQTSALRMPAYVIPHFTANVDNTITWDAMGWCVEASGSKEGDAVQVNRCTGGANQKWSWLPGGDGGTNQIQLKGTNKCMDVLLASDKRGSPLGLRECASAVSAPWRFEGPIPSALQEQGSSSFVRHVIIAVSSLAMLVGLNLGAWLYWRPLPNKRRAVAPLWMTQDGVCLTEHGTRPLHTPEFRIRARPVCSAATSFPKLGVVPEICDALHIIGVKTPNQLQVQAIPAISGTADIVLGAQTGSGKTLAYLVPIMQTLKAAEEALGRRAQPRRPRALVLLPTRELAEQVREVGRTLGQQIKLSVNVVSGGTPVGPQKRQLDLPTDVLVATPGRLLQHLDKANLYLGDVRHVVIDEVDTMFEAGFGDDIDKILAITTRDLTADKRAVAKAEEAPAAARARVQHVAVGATHTKAAMALYKKRLADATYLMVHGMHSVPSKLQQRFITCKGPDGKVAALRELLGPADKSGKPRNLGGRLVLFCNTQDSARFVDHHLTEEGYTTANYHGAVPANTRAENFERFKKEEASILVTTDLAARGLDNLNINHVVQFDFPKTGTDYLHRCGRTARAGRKGTVHNLVTKFDKDLVNVIRNANSKGDDLVSATEGHRDKINLSIVKPGSAFFPEGRGVPTKSAASFPEGKGLPSGKGKGQGKDVPSRKGKGQGKSVPSGKGKGQGKGVPSGKGKEKGRERTKEKRKYY